jgi:hypothetical protein
MSSLLAHWLTHYDPIHRGWTPYGIANGVCTTNGFSFPRVAGGYNLYRRDVGAEEAAIVGAASANADHVENFAWAAAGANDDVRFELRSIGGGGVESAASSWNVNVQFDGFAQPHALKPNSPQGLSIERRAAGRFELTWRYPERRQETIPEVFKIFSDNATGVVDYAAAVGEVAYRPRLIAHSFLTTAHSHGAVLRFAVRAFAASGEHDGNTVTVMQWADAVPPALPKVVLTEAVEAG